MPFTTAPEAPETVSPAKLITDTTATFEGVLNPKAAAAVKAGWYFAYSTEATCTGASTSAQEPEAVVKAQAESKKVTELQPNKKYEFCLVATNAAGTQSTAGNEVAFETKPAPPEVTGESTALPVKATEATLEAQVNPNNEATTYRFEYSTSATGETLNAPVTPLASATVLGGFGAQTAGVATGPILAQDTTYYYRVIAENEQSRKESKPVEGTIKHFKTAIAPETPEKLEAEPVTATEATLKGVLNPNKAGEAGTYEFAYRQSAGECQRENPETHLQENEKVSPESAGVSTGTTPEPKEAKVTGLLPGAQYTFCLIAHNTAGETTLSSPVTFTTLSAAPAIVSESAAKVEATAATLQARNRPRRRGHDLPLRIRDHRILRAEHAQNRAHRANRHRNGHCHDHRPDTWHDLPLPRARDQFAEPRRTTRPRQDLHDACLPGGLRAVTELSQRTVSRRTALRAGASGLPRV